MNKPVITVKNISKSYNISHEMKANAGTVTFRDAIINTLKKPKELLTGHIMKKEKFWALKGIDFEINKGEVVGIIGHNGSGKSTLLKILSRIVEPTKGEGIMEGRVASLLEVGTGFHPELTGRENVYFNGSILGMKKKEIDAKFDEIVEFSGVEKFLDTPVKFYSSGMYVRLAFAVAANLEPDILIVDEVLAVGDADFQKKCLGKMQDVAGQGRTVIFVSHSMDSVRRLCSRAILLEKGKVLYDGEVDNAIAKYLNPNSKKGKGAYVFKNENNKQIQFEKIEMINSSNKISNEFKYGQEWSIKFSCKVREETSATVLRLELFSDDEVLLMTSSNSDKLNRIESLKIGRHSYSIPFTGDMLMPGSYFVRLTIQQPGKVVYDTSIFMPFEIKEHVNDIRLKYFEGKHYGYLGKKITWENLGK